MSTDTATINDASRRHWIELVHRVQEDPSRVNVTRLGQALSERLLEGNLDELKLATGNLYHAMDQIEDGSPAHTLLTGLSALTSAFRQAVVEKVAEDRLFKFLRLPEVQNILLSLKDKNLSVNQIREETGHDKIQSHLLKLSLAGIVHRTSSDIYELTDMGHEAVRQLYLRYAYVPADNPQLKNLG